MMMMSQMRPMPHIIPPPMPFIMSVLCAALYGALKFHSRVSRWLGTARRLEFLSSLHCLLQRWKAAGDMRHVRYTHVL